MGVAYSGNDGTAVKDGVDQKVTKWTIEHDVATEDSTTTEDEGFDDHRPVSESFKGTFDFFYDPAKPYIGGKDRVSLTLNLPENTGSFSGYATITNLKLDSEVKGLVKYTATWMSRGSWTTP